MTRDTDVVLNSMRDMSEESTVSTALGLIDVVNVRQDFHCQKFRLRMLGYYIRSCHVIMCNTREMWGLFYSHAMRTLPMSCHVLPHVQ